jgi:hypothetical protein
MSTRASGPKSGLATATASRATFPLKFAVFYLLADLRLIIGRSDVRARCPCTQWAAS